MAFTRKKIAPPVLVALAALTASPTLAQERIIRDMFSIGGALIINGMEQRNRQQQTQAPRQRSVDPVAAQRVAEERERMRIIQTRLNALGYDAGTPDGVAGPRTRRAISNFQASIGEPETGALSEAQLVMLYERSSGFGAAPAMGYPVVGGAAAPAFPSLGTPVAAPSQPAPAFPTLGGSAPSPAAGAAPAFPQLAAPGAAQPVPAFPTISGAPVAAAPAKPLVAGEGAAPVALPPADNLGEEVGKTAYGSPDAQPDILGVTLGSPEADFVAMLTENEFAGCVAGAAAQQCVRETPSLTDTLKGWVAGEEGVWAMARLIQFKEPVEARFIKEQFTQTYPELMAAGNGLVSSGEACGLASQSVQALVALFDSRQDPAGTAEVPPALLQLAADCPVAYAVAFNEGNNLVAAVQVLMFDGTSVVRQQQRATTHRQSQLGTDLKF